MRSLRLFALVLIVAVFLASRAGHFLVVDNPQKSDAIVVLAGETIVRPARGLELLRQGMAAHMFIDAETGRIFDSHLTEIAQKYIDAQPEAKSIAVCGVASHSTVAETADVDRCLQPLQAHRVLLVTSDYHTRRALAIFSRRLPQYQWSVAAARNPAQFGDAWWTEREWAKVTFDEWTKFAWWEAIDRWK